MPKSGLGRRQSPGFDGRKFVAYWIVLQGQSYKEERNGGYLWAPKFGIRRSGAKFDKYFWYLREEKHEILGPHAFSIILKEGVNFTKDEFVTYLEKQGVDSRNLFYSIPTQTPSYQFMGHKLGDFPQSEYCSDHGTHLGCHQDVDIAQMDYVVEVVGKFLKSKGYT